MRARTLMCALLPLAIAAGCGKKKDGEAEKPAEAEPKAVEPPAPFTGPLTRDLVKSVKREHADMGAPWATSLAVVESMVGKPTMVDGDDYAWAVVDGEKCAFLRLEKAGETVGSREAGEIDKMMTSMFAECARAAGREVAEADEDPDAPGPPADGTAVTVAQVRDGVASAKSKWVGQQVTVEGVFVSTTQASAGGETSYTLSLAPDADNLGDTLGCALGATEPPELKQKDAVKVTGTVSESGRLTDCQIQ